ncbi:MAG: transglutaminaseTgpA domain-containing protein, partial [Gemmataceae bacterium]
MNLDRTDRALHHLTLALAGVTLTLAELPFIPWLPFGLIVYLLLILVAHSLRGRFLLPEWGANLLAVVVATVATLYIFLRSGVDLWADDVPLPAALVPYLGPVLMALLCVRLFRPRSNDDFWLLQGLALLQVGLGCILASGSLFALSLLLYLVVAGAALAAGERYRRGKRSAWVSGPTATSTRWMRLGLWWIFGVALLAVPLFLLSPRSDQPDWDPLARFGVRAQHKETRIGFSDELDMNRTGRLVPDDTIAFSVQIRDAQGNRLDVLAADALFRGSVLDRYENNIWRVEAGFPAGFAGGRTSTEFLDLGPEAIEVRFFVPRRANGLFLLDPIATSQDRKRLPIRLIGETAIKGPIFLNVDGTATPLPTAYLNLPEYRYVQYVLLDGPRDRCRAPRYRDSYLLRLLRCPIEDMDLRARGLLLGSPFTAPELREQLQTNERELPPRWWELIARALSEHLARSGEFRYSLQSERIDFQLEPTLDFLLNVRSGPCDRYASALALLLRSMGIPSRIVKGYRGVERV